MDWADLGMPWGAARPYPPPPHAYRDVEDLVVAFEADAAAVAPLLPPLVEPAADPVPCQAKFRRVGFSVHGPYREAYVAVTVTFGGARYRFVALIWTDSEIPLVAGREIWGYPKKLAAMRASWEGGGWTGEQLLGTVERPEGQRLMTVAMAPDRVEEPPEGHGLPALSLKVIPDATGAAPALARLIRLDGQGAVHRGPDGAAFRFAGRGALSFEAMSEVDPVWRFRPVRLTGASFTRLDLQHGPGVEVHDYLAPNQA